MSAEEIQLEIPHCLLSAPRKHHTWGFAIWLDPFGMSDPQLVLNLLQELGARADFHNWPSLMPHREESFLAVH